MGRRMAPCSTSVYLNRCHGFSNRSFPSKRGVSACDFQSVQHQTSLACSRLSVSHRSRVVNGLEKKKPSRSSCCQRLQHKGKLTCCYRPLDKTEHSPDRSSLPTQAAGLGVRGSPAAVTSVAVEVGEDVEEQEVAGAFRKSIKTGKPRGSPSDGIPGWVWLLLVAFLWGTYAPALRFLYSLPGAPTPSALLFVRTLLGAASLLVVDKLFTSSESPRSQRPHSQGPVIMTAPQEGPIARVINSTFGFVWLGGLELGFLKFMGEAFQAVGLTHTTAIRGAFLIQATSLFTPLIAALGGERLTQQVIMGGLTAVVGTCVMTLVNAGDHDGGASGNHNVLLAGGDAAILLAALMYSLSTVRLSKYAVQFAPVRLAAWKTLASAAVALSWFATDLLGIWSTGGSAAALWPGWQNPVAWLATLWLALGPGAFATYAQLKGQSQVPAAQSQVLYSTVPVWSALLAVTLLKGESAGWSEWVGGGLIVAASLISVGATPSDTYKKDRKGQQ